MSSGSKRPSYLFLLGAGFIVGIGFWLGSDIFPSLLSSDNIWDSILIILGFLSIINFVIWFSLSVFWNFIMSYAVKEENPLEDMVFDENVKVLLAIWGIFSLIFSGLMIWLFWENVFSLILSVIYSSFYILEMVIGNEIPLQEIIEEKGEILVLWPLLLFGALIMLVRFLIFIIKFVISIKNSVKK